nr:basic 7S globulin-like [Tanacetum cinerariifolium]
SNQFRPKALLLSVTKDSSTLQYVTSIHQRTSLVPVSLTLDVGDKSRIDLDEALQDDKRISYHMDYLSNLSAAIREDGCDVRGYFVCSNQFRPKALLLSVTKDSSTLQYVTSIHQRTSLVPVSLTLDVGARCRSAQCSLAKSTSCVTECPGTPKPGCNNNTCTLMSDNSVTRVATIGDLGSDVVTIQSTDGTNPGRVVSVP